LDPAAVAQNGNTPPSQFGNSTQILSFSQTSGVHPNNLASREYVPLAGDTSDDHTVFVCDVCYENHDRRDLLQIHKRSDHQLVEIPSNLGCHGLQFPDYLRASSTTSQQILSQSIFAHGGLSPSPCEPCQERGQACVVDPHSSSKCSVCAAYDNGSYCGAAGVKTRWVVVHRSTRTFMC